MIDNAEYDHATTPEEFKSMELVNTWLANEISLKPDIRHY